MSYMNSDGLDESEVNIQNRISKNHKIDDHKDKISNVQTDRHRPKINEMQSGPSCSKLTTSLVNASLKFTSSDTQIF